MNLGIQTGMQEDTKAGTKTCMQETHKQAQGFSILDNLFKL